MQLGFGRRFLGRFGRAGLPVGRCSADAGASCAASCEAGSSARRPRGSLSPGGSSVPGLRLLGAKHVAAVLQLARSGAAVLAKCPRMGKADVVPRWWIDNLPDSVRLCILRPLMAKAVRSAGWLACRFHVFTFPAEGASAVSFIRGSAMTQTTKVNSPLLCPASAGLAGEASSP